MHKICISTKQPRNITLKRRDGKQVLLYVTPLPDQIHISIKQHEDIPIGYRVMARTKMFGGKNNLWGIAWKLRKGNNHSCELHIVLT